MPLGVKHNNKQADLPLPDPICVCADRAEREHGIVRAALIAV
jgi:hypothetical protein